MTDYEIGPCGVEWPLATTEFDEATPAKPKPRDTYPKRCGTCGQPDRPYDHKAAPEVTA